jgi:hypothetical protein
VSKEDEGYTIVGERNEQVQNIPVFMSCEDPRVGMGDERRVGGRRNGGAKKIQG